MIARLVLLLFFCSFLHNPIAAINKVGPQDSVTVYVFLHESCRISQYYTLPLLKLNQAFSNDQLQFIGLFPNVSSQLEQIEAFKEKYKIPFELKTDYDKTKTTAFGATITPEVVVFNETQNKILYKGRIDDAYARVGKRKQVTSTSELKDVLTAIANDLPIEVTETAAIGCYINMR